MKNFPSWERNCQDNKKRAPGYAKEIRAEGSGDTENHILQCQDSVGLPGRGHTEATVAANVPVAANAEAERVEVPDADPAAVRDHIRTPNVNVFEEPFPGNEEMADDCVDQDRPRTA
jgi:hypothetical protein